MVILLHIPSKTSCLAQSLGFGQLGINMLDLRLGLFPIINVRGKCIPVENSPLAVSHGNPAGLIFPGDVAFFSAC